MRHEHHEDYMPAVAYASTTPAAGQVVDLTAPRPVRKPVVKHLAPEVHPQWIITGYAECRRCGKRWPDPKALACECGGTDFRRHEGL